MINLPTLITLSRFIFAIVVALLLCIDSNIAIILAVVMFSAGSISDFLDGAIARKRSNHSRFGAFIDPVADKFLVFIVLLSLIYNRDSLALFIISSLLISREIFVMSLREWMASVQESNSVKVSGLAKIKTFIQMSGICLVIGSPLTTLSYFNEASLGILLIGVIIGFYSAYKYFYKSIKYLT